MPDETDNDNQSPTPAPTPTPVQKKKSSAEIVNDDTSREVRKLQEQVSKLEDLLATEKTQREELQGKFNALGKIPGKTPGKSILTELNELVWGKTDETK